MIFDAILKWFRSGGNGADGGGADSSPEMLSCEEALSRLHEFLDGELDGLSRAQVAAHFEVCGRCYPHLASERAFKSALRRAVEGREAPPELRSRVLELLDEVVDDR